MKDVIRMNRLAGIITENQARKMMQVLNENQSLTDFIENYIGADESEFKNEDWFVEEDGTVEFTIPFNELAQMPVGYKLAQW